MTTSPRYPMRTRIVVVAVLAVAIGSFALAGILADTDHEEATIAGGAPAQSIDRNGVQAVTPANGAQTLSQQAFGIDLADGWTGEMTLQPPDGVAVFIPPDQLERSALNELIFQPGAGRVLESLPSGRNCVRATIWSLVQGRDATERVESWCFQVT